MAELALNLLAKEHIRKITSFYQEHSAPADHFARAYRKILTRYYNLLIPPDASVLEIGCGEGLLLRDLQCRRKVGIDLSEKLITRARETSPDVEFHIGAMEEITLDEKFDIIIISDTLNYVSDVQGILERLHHNSTPATRLLINFHNTLWRPILSIASRLRNRPQPLSSWLSRDDVHNLANLADWEIFKTECHILIPDENLLGARWINRWIAPFLRNLCLTIFCIARPKQRFVNPLTVSVIVPARNEAGNIEAAVTRTPEMGAGTELIFVEGNSTDDTWEKIQELPAKFPDRNIKILKQSGKGKGNAVREGFAVASGDILMILDADLTMPPEELPKFYEVLASGKADFANGVRLIYPMESEAMRFLNLCANKFFSFLFSWLLGQRVKDTLCGTKVLCRKEYDRIAANRAYFGDFDPFGDFDLLFGADKLNLRIMDVPIRYRDRTYGQTNIDRWRHGLLLFRMSWFCAKKIKCV
jgi:SAM-dependent methyltransferase